MARKAPKTRAGGTWTEARYIGFIRTALRQAHLRWPAKQMAKRANRREAIRTGSHKFEYQCVECGEWFMDKEVDVDHIHGTGEFTKLEHLPEFVARLFAEPDQYQILCKPCHKEKTVGKHQNQ